MDTKIQRTRKYDLQDLIGGITAENRHPETKTGREIGAEVSIYIEGQKKEETRKMDRIEDVKFRYHLKPTTQEQT